MDRRRRRGVALYTGLPPHARLLLPLHPERARLIGVEDEEDAPSPRLDPRLPALRPPRGRNGPLHGRLSLERR